MSTHNKVSSIKKLRETLETHSLDDEIACDVGETNVDGFCVENSYAAELQSLLDEADADDEAVSNVNKISARRFPLPGSSDDASNNLRTKKRTQRVSFLIAQVDAKQSAEPGQKKLRPREFLQKINGYGSYLKCNQQVQYNTL